MLSEAINRDGRFLFVTGCKSNCTPGTKNTCECKKSINAVAKNKHATGAMSNWPRKIRVFRGYFITWSGAQSSASQRIPIQTSFFLFPSVAFVFLSLRPFQLETNLRNQVQDFRRGLLHIQHDRIHSAH